MFIVKIIVLYVIAAWIADACAKSSIKGCREELEMMKRRHLHSLNTKRKMQNSGPKIHIGSI